VQNKLLRRDSNAVVLTAGFPELSSVCQSRLAWVMRRAASTTAPLPGLTTPASIGPANAPGQGIARVGLVPRRVRSGFQFARMSNYKVSDRPRHEGPDEHYRHRSTQGPGSRLWN
jgi:hypothetical protein